MPANTPNLALPYPVPADTVDVPRDVKALADKLDVVASATPLVTSLPGGPVDGQEVYYVAAGGASPTIWHLRYNGPLAAWDCIGGPPLHTEQTDVQAITTMWQDAGPPHIVAPLGGTYVVAIQCGFTMESGVATDSSFCYATVYDYTDGSWSGTRGEQFRLGTGTVNALAGSLSGSYRMALTKGHGYGIIYRPGVAWYVQTRSIELCPVGGLT